MALFKDLVPQLTTSADIFGNTEDAISRLNDVVNDSGSTDSGIAAAGSSVLSILGNAFSGKSITSLLVTESNITLALESSKPVLVSISITCS